jgi:DNA gyrase inhibitor GyrI
MDFKTETMQDYRIAFIRRTGPYGAGNVQTMEALKAWAAANALMNDEAIILGIARDDPQTTEPEYCRYDACIAVSGIQPISGGGVNEGRAGGGRYAVFKVDHTAEAVREAWNSIFQELFSRGYRIDTERPVIERFAVRMVREHRCELCVPIV